MSNEHNAGTIKAWGGAVIPSGWILCDGRAISRQTYKTLFAVIGTTYGEGDGSTTFNLPDTRESVLIGSGQNTTHNILAHDVYELGQFKDDQMQGHLHQVSNNTSWFNMTYNSTSSGQGARIMISGESPSSTTKAMTRINDDGTNGIPRTGTTTHGKQLGINYIIKY